MARINIDIGTLGNPATGDTLRGAMQKINSNFIEVYDDLAGASLGGLFTNNATNGDVKIQTNGTGIVEVDQLQINGDNITSMITNGDLTLSGNGTGGVEVLGAFTATSVTSNTISSNGSNAAITISANGTGQIVLSSAAALSSTLAVTGNIETASDLTVSGDATATKFIGDLRGATVFQAKATEDITKGEAVYISGLSGNTPEVALARASSASTMPAFGIADADIANTATGNIVTFGSSTGHNVADFGETSITFALGDTVFVSSSEAGKLTNVAPTGESNLIQNIGKIERVTPTTNMTIKVGGAGRTNATPALNSGNIFIGNGSNQSSTVPLATQLTNYVTLSVVGDDSTGTSFNIGESIKIAGAGSVTTAMSGDTLTITGSTGDLSISGSTISSPSNGDLTLTTAGTGGVAITPTKIMMANLPTSDPSNAGQLWNDSGTLKVSAG